MMNPKTALQLKKELLQKQNVLQSLHQTTKMKDAEIDVDLKDMADRSDVEETWFTKERMSQHWKLELVQIQTALSKIEQGTFGVCEECESEIPVKRLRVRPDAALCLFCQEAMERELGPNQRIAKQASAPVLLQ